MVLEGYSMGTPLIPALLQSGELTKMQYWYVVIGLLLIIVTLGVALATWIFLDERKTRTVAKKRAERRASLGGTLDR